MKASKIFDSWLRRHIRPAGESEDWQEAVRRELIEQQARGVSRREMVERLAKQMYAEDFSDLGQVADLGFFTWQLYLGGAQFVVNYLLPDAREVEEPKETPQQGGDQRRRVA